VKIYSSDHTLINIIPSGPKSLNSITMATVITAHMLTDFSSKNLKARNHLLDVGVDVSIILK
jgi:hypothetical protein